MTPNRLPERLREGIDREGTDPTGVSCGMPGIVEAEAVMCAAAEEIDRLRAENAEQDKRILEWGDQYADLSNEAALLRAENAELRKGIQDYLDGNYDGPPLLKVDKCPHGKFGWEACENCIDLHFLNILTRAAKD